MLGFDIEPLYLKSQQLFRSQHTYKCLGCMNLLQQILNFNRTKHQCHAVKNKHTICIINSTNKVWWICQPCISIIITCSVETKASCVNHIPLVWDQQCLLFMQILFIFLFYCSLHVSTETVFFILMISTNTTPSKDHHHHHHCQVQLTHFS